MKMRYTLLFSAFLAGLLCLHASAQGLPGLDALRAKAQAHSEKTGALSCKVRIQDQTGGMEGMLKIKAGKLHLDAERRDDRGRILGREVIVYDGKVIFVLAYPRGRAVPNVVKIDVARMDAVVKRLGDVQIGRPDLCGNPLTALLDLDEGYVVDILGVGEVGRRQLVRVEARRKQASERGPMWSAAEKISLLVDPDNGFAYYVGKFDKDNKPVWKQFVTQIIPAAQVPDKTFDYTPPAQALVQDFAETLEEVAAPDITKEEAAAEKMKR